MLVSDATRDTFRKNVKLVLKLGAGFFADAYDLFVIDIVLSILEEEAKIDGTGLGFSSSSKSLIAAATSIGAVFGMLLFGIVGDYVGRRTGVLITGSLVAAGSLMSAICVRSESMPLMAQLALYRTILGIGIGGEYPLSASMASEGAEASVRGRVVAGVFSMQGLGMLFSSLLGYIFVSLGASLEFTWRFLLAFGAVPAFIALYLRFNMHLHKTGSAAAEKEEPQATSVSRWDSTWFIIKENKRALFATATAWFLLDVTFYGTGEFKHSVSNEIFPVDPNLTASGRVASGALFGIIISAIAIPGYLCSCIFIDSIGRWRLQVLGFLAMAAAYILVGVAVRLGAPAGLNLFVFGLTFFFTNFGPNTTTFIIPSEIYPSAVRATCHGISAAAGKFGAIIGAAGFPPCINALGLDGVMYICAAIAVAGLIVTVRLLDRSLVAQSAQRPKEVSCDEDSSTASASASVKRSCSETHREQSQCTASSEVAI